ERGREVEGVDALVAAERLVGREEVTGRGLGCRRQLLGGAQACVERVGCEIDVVAKALVAEEDVQRHDTPVRETLGSLGEIGGRIEDDRSVLSCEVHQAAFLIASTISSSSWSLDRHATAPAS